MTNKHVQNLISQYYQGNRSDSLRQQILAAIDNFSNKQDEESEAEDLENCNDEDCWKQAIGWLQRHGYND